MSDGHHMKGQTLKEAPTKLALAELRSVQWVQGQQTAMTVYQAIAQRYASLKQILVVGWFIVIMEVIAVWWWTFLHNVSWPQGLLNIIARMDVLTVDILEVVQQRLEWVNCAKQMVGLNTRQYGESFLDFCQRWAKDLGLLDLILTIQEEMREQPFLAKPLALVRVLSEAWLGFLLRLVKGKKSRRTRSMRSESLRRRVLSQSGTSNPLPLSPAALQQSSEPVQQPRLTVQPTLQEAALKEEEEDLEGFLSKDSALGSEDNRSETIDSDLTISHNDEGLESDSDLERHMSWNNTNSPREAQGTPLGDIQETQEITPISFTDGEKSSTLCSENPNSTTLLTDSRNSSPSTLTNSPVTFCGPDLLNQNSQLQKPKPTKPKRVTYQ